MTSRRVAMLAALGLFAGDMCAILLGAGRQPGVPARTPVLVELFTSEGCSSCPPADDILTRLVAEQPVAGVEVIALGFHVDYWDQLGWRDRFSSLAYTIRQQDYAGPGQSARVYTPQAIVDGIRTFVGSDAKTAHQSILEAASMPKLAVTIDASGTAEKSGRVAIAVRVRPEPERGETSNVLLALTEDGLVSDVKRGENASRRLTHVAVVRSLDEIGRFDSKQGFSATRDVRLDPAWRRDAIKVVAFVQDRRSRRVLGVAARSIS